MKKLHFAIIITALLSLMFMTTSSRTSDIIYWSEDYKLNWSDFKADPQHEYKTISALSSSGIMHAKGCKNGKINYEVLSYFERAESWVKSEARTNYHLGHEQLHFDITELYARKLRKALSEKEFTCGQEQAFEKFVEKFILDWHTEQRQYDSHSRHSIDKEAQAEWIKKINTELKALDAYK